MNLLGQRLAFKDKLLKRNEEQNETPDPESQADEVLEVVVDENPIDTENMKIEVEVITEPKPGQEFVVFQSSPSSPSSKVQIINVENATTAVELSPLAEEIIEAILTPEEILPIVEFASPVMAVIEDVPVETAEDIAVEVEETTNLYPADAFVTEEVSEYDSVTEVPESTDSPLYEEALDDLEVITTNKKHTPSLAVNDFFGKHFDESELDFGKGINLNDKVLSPAETEQKVRSKIEIKEVNGQLYEYEYLYYYYDDEYPVYDNFDFEEEVQHNKNEVQEPVSTTSTTTTTTTTTTTPAPVASSSRGSSRGRRPSNNLIDTVDKSRAITGKIAA